MPTRAPWPQACGRFASFSPPPRNCASTATPSKWKDTLRALPERHGCLVPWLDDALQRLHRRGRQISVTQAELLAGLQPRSGWATPDEWLQAVRSLNLIGDGGHDEFSTEPLLRCTHQLWQEFFAARGIRDWAATQPERLPDLTPPQPPPLADTLAKLGVQEPLPGPDPTHWEEPVKLAVQLLRDPAPWIAQLRPRNLALAGRAAVACHNRLDAATLGPLRQALLARSRDAATDLRLRIEAGAVLGDLGDPRWEERREVRREVRRGPASASPGSGDAARYLWPTQWVAVPAGTYRLGDDRSPRPNEQPESAVALAAFEMAFAPVTNAEFRCFIDAGGYDDERWWRSERAATWRRSGLRNTDSIDWWRPRMLALSRDFDAGVREYFAGNPQSYIDGVLRTYEHWTPEQIERSLERSFGATLARSPAKWTDPNFNHPSQPVVGVSLFEAQAYCCWLSHVSGAEVTLPTEAEWEAAARGSEGRCWPWGNRDPEPGQLNNDDAHLRRTTPVGVFPLADTPGGLTDLAGNVWEWTCSAVTDRIDAPPPGHRLHRRG
jgi:formylglycine-generating enzyme required for sulfatase activity